MALIEYAVRDGVAYITINRPQQKNALNLEMRVDLCRAWDAADSDRSVAVVLLTGAGDTFSAGHDLKEQLTPDQEAADPGSPKVYGGLHALTKPVVVAINGPCLAQGAGLALLADIRVASETASFGWPQAKRGLSSVSGPTLLARRVPWNIAMEYLMTGKSLPIDVALRWGLVNTVVAPADLVATAETYARQIAESAPLAVRAIKEVARLTAGMDQQLAFDVAWRIRQQIFQSEDAREGRAAFAEKRQPVWHGR